jgi:hypothetical protein
MPPHHGSVPFTRYPITNTPGRKLTVTYSSMTITLPGKMMLLEATPRFGQLDQTWKYLILLGDTPPGVFS